jgi:hypothetical protein
MTRLVEAMHHNIARKPWPFQPLDEAPAPGITGFVYASIRGTTALIRAAADDLFGVAQPLLPASPESPAEAAWRAALNGVLGHHLAASGNPLAIPMRFRRDGAPLELTPEALSAHIPDASSRLLLFVHGLCMNDLQWTRNGHNHAESLARELGCTPIYLHYNSGLHISTNGREFAQLLERLLAAWPVPVESLAVLAHSMGGLVTRSACHYAKAQGLSWPAKLNKIVFLGTPHHGAPLERYGNRLQRFFGISPYIAPLGRLGMIRSAGITDLRYGNLLDDDWRDRDRFAPADDRCQHVPLPAGVKTFAAAATLGQRQGDFRDRWLADCLVPLYSALGRHRDPARRLHFRPARQWVGYGMNHWDLLDSRPLYAQIRRWLA